MRSFSLLVICTLLVPFDFLHSQIVVRDSIGPDSTLTDGLGGGSTTHVGADWSTPGLVFDAPNTGLLSEARFVIFARNSNLNPENDLADIFTYHMEFHLWTEGILGDVNQDGAINLPDVEPFIDLLSLGEYQFEADIDGNGVVNLLDVDPFILLLSGGLERETIVVASTTQPFVESMQQTTGFWRPIIGEVVCKLLTGSDLYFGLPAFAIDGG